MVHLIGQSFVFCQPYLSYLFSFTFQGTSQGMNMKVHLHITSNPDNIITNRMYETNHNDLQLWCTEEPLPCQTHSHADSCRRTDTIEMNKSQLDMNVLQKVLQSAPLKYLK